MEATWKIQDFENINEHNERKKTKEREKRRRGRGRQSNLEKHTNKQNLGLTHRKPAVLLHSLRKLAAIELERQISQQSIADHQYRNDAEIQRILIGIESIQAQYLIARQERTNAAISGKFLSGACDDSITKFEHSVELRGVTENGDAIDAVEKSGNVQRHET